VVWPMAAPARIKDRQASEGKCRFINWEVCAKRACYGDGCEELPSDVAGKKNVAPTVSIGSFILTGGSIVIIALGRLRPWLFEVGVELVHREAEPLETGACSSGILLLPVLIDDLE